MEDPKNWSWVIPAFAFVACLVGLPFVPSGLVWLSGLLIGGTIIFLIWTGVNLTWIIVCRIQEAQREHRNSAAVTPESELARMLQTLPMESQRFLLDRFKLSIERHLSSTGQAVEMLGPTGVPVQWVVDNYLPNSSGMAVCPTGNFNEGSIGRDYCERTTQYLISIGLALPFQGGNVSSRWAPGVTPAFLWHALGYSLNMDDSTIS